MRLHRLRPLLPDALAILALVILPLLVLAGLGDQFG